MIRQSDLVIIEVPNSHDAATPGRTILTYIMPRIFPTPLHLCTMNLLSGKDPILTIFFGRSQAGDRNHECNAGIAYQVHSNRHETLMINRILKITRLKLPTGKDPMARRCAKQPKKSPPSWGVRRSASESLLTRKERSVSFRNFFVNVTYMCLRSNPFTPKLGVSWFGIHHFQVFVPQV